MYTIVIIIITINIIYILLPLPHSLQEQNLVCCVRGDSNQYILCGWAGGVGRACGGCGGVDFVLIYY